MRGCRRAHALLDRPPCIAAQGFACSWARADQGELQEALGHWRAKALGGAREWDARNRALAAEKASMLALHAAPAPNPTNF
jgi:hypothetical protein